MRNKQVRNEMKGGDEENEKKRWKPHSIYWGKRKTTRDDVLGESTVSVIVALWQPRQASFSVPDSGIDRIEKLRRLMH